MAVATSATPHRALGRRLVLLVAAGLLTLHVADAGAMAAQVDNDAEISGDPDAGVVPRVVEMQADEACHPAAIRFEALLRVDPDYEGGAAATTPALAGTLALQLARDPDARLTDHPVGDILEGQPVAGELNVEQAIADLGLTPSEAEFVVRARVDVPDDEVVLVSEWTWLAFDCAPPQPAGLVLEVEVVAVEFTADDPERVEVGYRFSLLEASDQNVWSLRITDDRLASSALQAALEAALATAHSTSYLPAGGSLAFEVRVPLRLAEFDVVGGETRAFVHRTTIVGIGENTGADVEGSAMTTVVLPPPGQVDDGDPVDEGGHGRPGDDPDVTEPDDSGSGPALPTDEPDGVDAIEADGGQVVPLEVGHTVAAEGIIDPADAAAGQRVRSPAPESRDAPALGQAFLVRTGSDAALLALLGSAMVAGGLILARRARRAGVGD